MKRIATWACPALFVAGWLLAQTSAPRPAIRLVSDKTGSLVEVGDLNKETLTALARLAPDDSSWSKVFSVHVVREGKTSGDLPAMLGTSRIEKGALRFTPRFPLVPGVRYRATFDPSTISGGKHVEAILSLPRPATRPTTVVSQVYPSGDRLPENLLKFYLHFSAPMRQGDCYRHVQLLDSRGKAIDLPFLELDQELWDSTGTRLTLFLDPGRIKRGLKPREEVGPVLEEGKRYTLVIDRAWKDAAGNPLKEAFRKTFTALAPDDRQPDPKKWKLAIPPSTTRQPVRVTFPKAMDHALAQRLVWVVSPEGKKLTGKTTLSERETVWTFTPETAWRTGTHHLVADTQLEDQTGNNLARPFEVDVFRPVERAIKAETMRIAFVVK